MGEYRVRGIVPPRVSTGWRDTAFSAFGLAGGPGRSGTWPRACWAAPIPAETPL